MLYFTDFNKGHSHPLRSGLWIEVWLPVPQVEIGD
jgi:hypothetical protein